MSKKGEATGAAGAGLDFGNSNYPSERTPSRESPPAVDGVPTAGGALQQHGVSLDAPPADGATKAGSTRSMHQDSADCAGLSLRVDKLEKSVKALEAKILYSDLVARGLGVV
jgi:hypothetical protein